ncbi:hypothetical protein IW261DRAFT_1457828 [Armillaria novae-zelandiae]|uniref:Uncharacterized protein n=1 Tax=Armillaria novae-zelandiae TaxID=153914 RepID=A0AA39UIY4_9AGAR|nr:hypothetical protein IW261DRAFT_1457828 [Armillaria novae-zelandiae]
MLLFRPLAFHLLHWLSQTIFVLFLTTFTISTPAGLTAEPSSFTEICHASQGHAVDGGKFNFLRPMHTLCGMGCGTLSALSHVVGSNLVLVQWKHCLAQNATFASSISDRVHSFLYAFLTKADVLDHLESRNLIYRIRFVQNLDRTRFLSRKNCDSCGTYLSTADIHPFPPRGGDLGEPKI